MAEHSNDCHDCELVPISVHQTASPGLGLDDVMTLGCACGRYRYIPAKRVYDDAPVADG